MASAQVLKKQEHLEAGKKKLEEFRRRRAAKKATSTNVINEKQPSETEHVRVIDSNGVGTSDTLAEGRLETSADVPKIVDKPYDIPGKGDFSSSSDKNVKSSLSDRSNDIYVYPYSNNEEYRDNAASIHFDDHRSGKDKSQSRNDEYGASADIASEIGKKNIFDHKVSSAEENHASSYFTSDGLDKYSSNDIHRPEKDVGPVNSTSSSIFTADIMPQDLANSLTNSRHEDNKLTTSSYPESHYHPSSNINDSAFGFKPKFSVFSDMGEKKFGGDFNHLQSANHSSAWTSDEKYSFSDMGEKKFGGDFNHLQSANHSSPWTSVEKYSDYNSEERNSSNNAPPSPPASGRRSRPSFLDSIPISKGPSSSSLFGTEKTDTSNSKVNQVDGMGSSVSQILTNNSIASGNGVGLFNHITENKHAFFSQKQNEDFAALEQHIEDLTQEKYSLQRALEASRALSESLASENSVLTDSFNQQGTVVNQLKFDLEGLQEDIKAQLEELKAVKMEYANAQLECDAADERAKLLASEVIALEEKALRLRSNELKLERELENTQAEISSYRKRMSSLEKDRQDLQSTIDALQEEKKLLQSKLRKASSSGKSEDFNKTSTSKTDVSTSTEDIDTTTTESANLGSSGTVLLGDEVPSAQFPPENVHLSFEGLPVALPSDQIRTIQNINTLIAELALEKDQLMQALSTESSQSFKLLELNKELTRKLEAQTQRSELLMAQSMANDNNLPRHQDIRTVHESTPYADEGDEVVERVLGWIMKLFPGGPSRRRPSKHL